MSLALWWAFGIEYLKVVYLAHVSIQLKFSHYIFAQYLLEASYLLLIKLVDNPDATRF
jgi:hypothetical protein